MRYGNTQDGLLRLAFDHAGDGLAMLDAKLRVQRANRAFLAMRGWREADVVGKVAGAHWREALTADHMVEIVLTALPDGHLLLTQAYRHRRQRACGGVARPAGNRKPIGSTPIGWPVPAGGNSICATLN